MFASHLIMGYSLRTEITPSEKKKKKKTKKKNKKQTNKHKNPLSYNK